MELQRFNKKKLTPTFIFTALQCMQAWSSWSSSRLSVRLSDTHVNCDKTNKSSADILIPYEGKFIYFFGHKEWMVGDDPLYLKFWVKLTHPASKHLEKGDFQSIFARSGSAVTSSEKSSIMTKRKSPTSFPMSLRWTAYVAPNPQMGPQKRKFAMYAPTSSFPVWAINIT